MSSHRKFSTNPARLSYTSPDGRIVIEYERGEPKPFALYADGAFRGYFATSSAAEVEGLIYLEGRIAEDVPQAPALAAVNWGSAPPALAFQLGAQAAHSFTAGEVAL